jgi:prenylcysteine oxidase/farnesylcysteine lyase
MKSLFIVFVVLLVVAERWTVVVHKYVSSSQSSSQSSLFFVTADTQNHHHNDDIYSSYQSKKLKKKQIAIIGGGISGTFLAKYLVDYDVNCTTFDTITIFEPDPVQGPIRRKEEDDRTVASNNNNNNDRRNEKPNSSSPSSSHSHHQSSRIASYEMEIEVNHTQSSTNHNATSTNNNTTTTNTTTKTKIIIEVGASILYQGFHHVMEMIQQNNDHPSLLPPLQIGVPYTTGNTTIDTYIHDPTSMGIYNGNGTWKVLLVSSTVPIYLRNYYLLLRYSWDLITVSRLCQYVQKQYNRLPMLLNQTHDFFMDSPQQLWDHLQLYHPYITQSFDTYLDSQGISPYSTTTNAPTTTGTTTPIIIRILNSIYRTIRNTITSVWYRVLPFQGSIRSELLNSINIVNYNQNNTQINAMTGFAHYDQKDVQDRRISTGDLTTPNCEKYGTGKIPVEISQNPITADTGVTRMMVSSDHVIGKHFLAGSKTIRAGHAVSVVYVTFM